MDYHQKDRSQLTASVFGLSLFVWKLHGLIPVELGSETIVQLGEGKFDLR